MPRLGVIIKKPFGCVVARGWRARRPAVAQAAVRGFPAQQCATAAYSPFSMCSPVRLTLLLVALWIPQLGQLPNCHFGGPSVHSAVRRWCERAQSPALRGESRSVGVVVVVVARAVVFLGRGVVVWAVVVWSWCGCSVVQRAVGLGSTTHFVPNSADAVHGPIRFCLPSRNRTYSTPRSPSPICPLAREGPPGAPAWPTEPARRWAPLPPRRVWSAEAWGVVFPRSGGGLAVERRRVVVVGCAGTKARRSLPAAPQNRSRAVVL